ncbi:hypothetical protein P8452_14174 [Trifolium repens]|nr:hypothetical protein P8452_14174 [Trifolium repens]
MFNKLQLQISIPTLPYSLPIDLCAIVCESSTRRLLRNHHLILRVVRNGRTLPIFRVLQNCATPDIPHSIHRSRRCCKLHLQKSQHVCSTHTPPITCFFHLRFFNYALRFTQNSTLVFGKASAGTNWVIELWAES